MDSCRIAFTNENTHMRFGDYVMQHMYMRFVDWGMQHTPSGNVASHDWVVERISIADGHCVGDTIATIQHNPRGATRRVQAQHGLHRHVHSRDVKCLEQNLARLKSQLRIMDNSEILVVWVRVSRNLYVCLAPFLHFLKIHMCNLIFTWRHSSDPSIMSQETVTRRVRKVSRQKDMEPNALPSQDFSYKSDNHVTSPEYQNSKRYNTSSRLRRGFSGASVKRTGCSSAFKFNCSLLYRYAHSFSISFQLFTIPCSMGYEIFSNPRCCSAFGPTNSSVGRSETITRTCLARPIEFGKTHFGVLSPAIPALMAPEPWNRNNTMLAITYATGKYTAVNKYINWWCLYLRCRWQWAAERDLLWHQEIFRRWDNKSNNAPCMHLKRTRLC